MAASTDRLDFLFEYLSQRIDLAPAEGFVEWKKYFDQYIEGGNLAYCQRLLRLIKRAKPTGYERIIVRLSEGELSEFAGDTLIGHGCDVVFGVDGNAVNGALLAAKENNLPTIGADVDEYNTYPEMKDALISSAQKNVDVVVYNYLKSVANGSVKADISTATLQNGGVGLAPSMIGTARSQPI